METRKIGLMILAACFLTLTACSGQDGEEDSNGKKCERNSDCDSNEVCDDNVCVDDNDDGDDESPSSSGCDSNAECRSSEVCTIDRVCVPTHTGGNPMPSNMGCESISDCDSDEVCDINGKCVDIDDGSDEPGNVECEETNDCPGSLVCRNNECVYECERDADCSSGYFCNASHMCEGVPNMSVDECDNNRPCRDGEVCQSGQCVDDGIDDPEPPEYGCVDNDDCLQWQICNSSRTCEDVMMPVCTVNSDCGAGKICIDNGLGMECVDKPECDEDEDCGANMECNSSWHCVPKDLPLPDYLRPPMIFGDSCDGGECTCTVSVLDLYAHRAQCAQIQTNLPRYNGKFYGVGEKSDEYFTMRFTPQELESGRAYELTFYSSQQCAMPSNLGAPSYGTPDFLACMEPEERSGVWCTWDMNPATNDYCNLRPLARVFTNNAGQLACRFEYGGGNMGNPSGVYTLGECGAHITEDYVASW